ncbi:MAG: hypothetical protein WDM91_10840 [Rhizomicrobium sp.]
MTEPSGAQWCARFPTSTSLDDLVEPFRDRAKAFIAALKAAGAFVTVSATYRPAERAYLMHYACLVAGYRDTDGIHRQIAPAVAPAMAGVPIDWTCGGQDALAFQRAREMVAGYGIAYPAALVSRHTQRRAVDMTIHWPETLLVQDGNGVPRRAATQQDLWPIGASFGVHKLPSDPPHWSDDGH